MTGARIELPSMGRTVALGSYLLAVKIAKGNRAERRIMRQWELGGPAILADLLRRTHADINRHVPGYGQGRKWREQEGRA